MDPGMVKRTDLQAKLVELAPFVHVPDLSLSRESPAYTCTIAGSDELTHHYRHDGKSIAVDELHGEVIDNHGNVVNLRQLYMLAHSKNKQRDRIADADSIRDILIDVWKRYHADLPALGNQGEVPEFIAMEGARRLYYHNSGIIALDPHQVIDSYGNIIDTNKISKAIEVQQMEKVLLEYVASRGRINPRLGLRALIDPNSTPAQKNKLIKNIETIFNNHNPLKK